MLKSLSGKSSKNERKQSKSSFLKQKIKLINLITPLALDDAYYDLRDSITTVELLLLRVLQFRIPEPHFFDYLTKFLYSMERWCHGRVNPNNQEQVKLFQAVSRTAGNELLPEVGIWCTVKDLVQTRCAKPYRYFSGPEKDHLD